MRKLITFTLCVFLSAHLYAQEFTLMDYKNDVIGKLNTKNSKANSIDFGTLREYHETGQLKAEGKVKTDTYVQCCFIGPCDQPYMFKVDTWKFYYENGNLRAKGIFIPGMKKIETSCEGGDNIVAGFVNKEWVYFDRKGLPIDSDEDFIEEIQNGSYIIDYRIKK